MKRQWLNVSLSLYEMQLQVYDQQCREILIELKSSLITRANLQDESLFNQTIEYLTNRTKQLKQKSISRIPALRGKLLRNRQRSSASQNTMIGVSPEPYLDLITNPFDTREWHYLSLGKSVFCFF